MQGRLRLAGVVWISGSVKSWSARAAAIMWEGRKTSPSLRDTARWGGCEKRWWRGGRSVALQVLSHVIALFYTAFERLFFFGLFWLRPSVLFFAISFPSNVWLLFISLFSSSTLYNEQSPVQASVLSLMWSVQKRDSCRDRHTNTHKPHIYCGSPLRIRLRRVYNVGSIKVYLHSEA